MHLILFLVGIVVAFAGAVLVHSGRGSPETGVRAVIPVSWAIQKLIMSWLRR